MDADKFYNDMEGLCKKHGLTHMSTIFEDLNPYKCAALSGGIEEVSLCPVQTKRGGTNINIELYTPDSLVIRP